MSASTPRQAPAWAGALRAIPTLVTIGVIALMLIYKPNGYVSVVGGFILAYVFGGVILFTMIRKARRKQTHG